MFAGKYFVGTLDVFWTSNESPFSSVNVRYEICCADGSLLLRSGAYAFNFSSGGVPKSQFA